MFDDPPNAPKQHVRAVTAADRSAPHPLYCVWEITLACDLGCKHCGSRAGPARPGELTTQGCLDVVRELDELGLREVTLIGGEAYLREDWDIIAADITRRGMVCGITTGARNLTPDRIQRAVDAGVRTISISIDGLEQIHDAQRGSVGSWRAAVDAAMAVAKTPMRLATNSQINRLSMPELPAMATLLNEIGSKAWQIQLTVPMGHAADRPDLLLQPWELLELYPLLVQIKTERLDPHGISLYPGNNIGYFGPYEQALRYGGDQGAHWQGCSAGEWTLGLEADGKIKGCPSLPSDRWTGGVLGQDKLADIVRNTPELTYLKGRTTEDLWGFCKTCYYADVCKAGCTWTSYVFFNRDGNNPYCIHRAMEHDAAGQRERLLLAEAAPGEPFDNGRFDLHVEPRVAPSPSPSPSQSPSPPPPAVLGFAMADVLALTPQDASIWQPDAMWSVLAGSSRKAGRRVTELAIGRSQSPSNPASEPARAPDSDRALDVLQAVLLKQCAILQSRSAGVRADVGGPVAVQHLHKMRVALRRSRALLSLLRGAFPPAVAKRFRKKLRWIGRITGPTRELDVWVEALSAYLQQQPVTHRAQLAPLLEQLQRRRDAANAELLRQLDRKRFHQTLRDWHHFLSQPYREEDRPAEADEAVGPRAAAVASQLFGRLTGSAIVAPPRSTDAAMHAVRLDVKKLRYLLTLMVPYFPGDVTVLVDWLRDLQRSLGTFNDHAEQLRELDDLVPALGSDRATVSAYLVAVQRLAGDLRAQRNVDRQRFAGRFEDFLASDHRERYRHVFGN